MLLEVGPPLITGLVPIPRTIGLLLLPLFKCSDFLLLAIADTNHAQATVSASNHLTTAATALLTVFHLSITIFVILWCGEATLCVLHALGDARVVAQVLPVVLVERPVTGSSARGEVQLVFVMVDSGGRSVRV